MPTPREDLQLIISKIRMITVEPILFLFMLATALTAPTIQALVYKKVCLQHFNTSICDNLQVTTNRDAEDTVQKLTSHWYLVENLCYEIPSILTSLIYGNVSDHISRRLAIMLPLIGQTLSSISYVTNAAIMSLPVGYIIVGPLVSGWFGGWIGCCLAVFSYISDDSSRETRTIRIGIAEAIITVGLSMAAFSGGTLLDHTSYVFVTSLGLGLYIMAFLYTYLVVRDPRKKHDPTIVADSHVSVHGCMQKFSKTISPRSFKDAIVVVFRKRNFNRRIHICALLIFHLTAYLAHASGAIAYLYVKRNPLSWTQTTYGYYSGTSYAIHTFSLLAVLPILKKKLHLHDSTILILTMVTKTLAEMWFAFSIVTWMVFIVPVIGSLIGAANAACTRSLLSSFVEPHEYGQTFAVFGSLQSISGIMSAMVYNYLYPVTLRSWAGMCFIIGVVFSIIPIGLIIWLRRDLQKMKVYGTLRESDDEDDIATIRIKTECT